NRAAAVHALRSVDGSSVAGPLVEAFDDPDAWVRYFAAGAVARRGDRAAAPTLARVAADDGAPHVRIAALEALAAIDRAMACAIAEPLVDADDRDVAAAALGALASGSAPGVDNLLERAVRSDDPALRRGGVLALASRSNARAAEMLAWSARLAEPPDLPSLAIGGLAAIAGRSDADGSPAALEALLE